MYLLRQSNKSVILAVITSYSQCFVRMLPASRLPAHFTALFYFVSIHLRLLVALPVGLPRLYADGALHTLPVFTQKVISRPKQNVASHSL